MSTAWSLTAGGPEVEPSRLGTAGTDDDETGVEIDRDTVDASIVLLKVSKEPIGCVGLVCHNHNQP